MDALLQILGSLGAYFAVMLVLSVAVESLVDPITTWFGIFQRKLSPEEMAKDLAEWLPDGDPRQKASAATIAKFIQQYETSKDKVAANAKEIKAIVDDTAKAFGLKLADAEAKIQTELAIRLIQIRDKYKIDERRRIALLRMVSAILGILIAWALNINSFELLSDVFSANVMAIFNTDAARIGGIVLSGLAASAGSSFWHDQLGRIRAVKEATIKGQEIAK